MHPPARAGLSRKNRIQASRLSLCLCPRAAKFRVSRAQRRRRNPGNRQTRQPRLRKTLKEAMSRQLRQRNILKEAILRPLLPPPQARRLRGQPASPISPRSR